MYVCSYAQRTFRSHKNGSKVRSVRSTELGWQPPLSPQNCAMRRGSGPPFVRKKMRHGRATQDAHDVTDISKRGFTVDAWRCKSSKARLCGYLYRIIPVSSGSPQIYRHRTIRERTTCDGLGFQQGDTRSSSPAQESRGLAASFGPTWFFSPLKK